MEGLRLEVQHARENGRKRPRSGSYGLPGVKMKLPFSLSPEEYALVEKALRKIAQELSGMLSGPEEIGPKEALLFLSKRVLETDPATALEGRVEREDSIYTILYHRCPDCHRSHLATEDGPVEVASEAVDRTEGRAHKGRDPARGGGPSGRPPPTPGSRRSTGPTRGASSGGSTSGTGACAQTPSAGGRTTSRATTSARGPKVGGPRCERSPPLPHVPFHGRAGG